jgi:hypothetical protein
VNLGFVERQKWFEENKTSVTNLNLEEANYSITKGIGFCLFTDLFDPKDIDDANVFMTGEVEKEEEAKLDAKNLTEDEGHANIYSHSKTGRANTLGKRVWNLTNKGECFERMV